MARRPKDALQSAQHAAELFPRAPGVLASLGNTYADQNMATEAIATHQKLVSLNPRGKWFLGAVYAQLGQKENALRIVAELESEPITPFVAYGLGEIHSRLGQLDRAFHWLNYGEPHAWLPWVRVLPGFAALRADPRYKLLLDRVKLPA